MTHDLRKGIHVMYLHLDGNLLVVLRHAQNAKKNLLSPFLIMLNVNIAIHQENLIVLNVELR